MNTLSRVTDTFFLNSECMKTVAAASVSVCPFVLSPPPLPSIGRPVCNARVFHQGLGRLSATNGGIPSFRELVGVHDLWKAYASRLASSAKNAKALEQRILTADLQVRMCVPFCHMKSAIKDAQSSIHHRGLIVSKCRIRIRASVDMVQMS